jgi:hypothetical protein
MLNPSVPDPTSLDPVSNDVSRARFIKFGKPHVGRMKTVTVERDPNFKPPAALIALRGELDALHRPKSLDDVVTRMSMFAEVNFNLYSNRVPMLLLYDEDWKQIDYLSMKFTDQADKFLFWRNAASRASYLRAAALVWVGESWLRELSKGADLPIREMPIIGEQLQVIGATFTGETKVVEWTITRFEGPKHPVLQPVSPDAAKHDPANIFFIKPIVDAIRAVRPKTASK